MFFNLAVRISAKIIAVGEFGVIHSIWFYNIFSDFLFCELIKY